MSFSLTTPQMRARTKTVTRRLGWKTLKPGTMLIAVEKSQGLGKGGKVKRIGFIEVVQVWQQPLRCLLSAGYGDAEASLEGFPNLTGAEFAEMFCKHMRCDLDQVVTRIEFRHVGEGA